MLMELACFDTNIILQLCLQLENIARSLCPFLSISCVYCCCDATFVMALDGIGVILERSQWSYYIMWANAQRDDHPAEYRWRPLFNAAKFG